MLGEQGISKGVNSIRQELDRCLPDATLDEGLRSRMWEKATAARRPATVSEAAIRRLED